MDKRTHATRDPHAPAGFGGGQPFGRVPEMVHAGALGNSLQEHNPWVAEEGRYAFEPPGEIHAPYGPPDVPEMITLSHATGGHVYIGAAGNAVGDEDVFTKIAHARRHQAHIGLGADHVQRYTR